MHIHVGKKNISIKDEVYEALLALKKVDESFSDLLERLTKEDLSF
ncbi:MAG: antitoxin VapB family protein [Nitrososphaerales archaeon]